MRESAWSMLLAVQMFFDAHYKSLFPFLWGGGVGGGSLSLDSMLLSKTYEEYSHFNLRLFIEQFDFPSLTFESLQ